MLKVGALKWAKESIVKMSNLNPGHVEDVVNILGSCNLYKLLLHIWAKESIQKIMKNG